MLTVEELMKPRYKVIHSFPNMGLIGETGFSLGQIFYPEFKHNKHFFNGVDVGGYRHLFEKLEWYDERKKSELPKFIKKGNKIREVNEWIGVMAHFNEHRRHGKDIAWMKTNEWLPAEPLT